jgi:predicted unusual protein kinase regulating ubiquinone biosynthesis (AarF/ABC1/UbiB family)
MAGLAKASAQSLGRGLRRRVRWGGQHIKPETSVAATLGRLKGVTMKWGQLLGYLDLGLPDNLRAALSALHTQAQPLALDRIVAVLEADLGAAGRELARAMSPRPLSTASLGQVHLSTLPDGTPVAVKVLHPGIAETIKRDFLPAAVSSRVTSWIYPRAGLYPLVTELRARLIEECNYALEARRQDRFGALFAHHPTLVVPTVYHDYSSARILTTGFVDGVHLDAYLASSPSAEARARVGEALFDFYLGALFKYGLYNCDANPGNYLFLPDGRLAIVDFGSAREFEPGLVVRLAALFEALRADDQGRMHEALLALGVVDGKPYDREAARWLLGALFGPLLRDEVTTFDPASGVRIRELFRRWRRARGLGISAELLFLLRATAGLSSVLARLGARANWYRRLQALIGEAILAGELAATSPPPSKAGRAGAPAPEPGIEICDLVLVDPGATVIALVRELRELTGLELAQVKYLIDASPQTLRRALPRPEAEGWQRRLERAGARVEVRKSSPAN